MTNPGLKAKLL